MQTWDRGVDIETPKLGKYRIISSTEEAVRCLTGGWPRPQGTAFISAVRACIEALENHSDKDKREIAREAFIKAATEADISIRPQ